MKNMNDKKELVKEFIQNRPNLSGNKIYKKLKEKEFSIRKSDFYSLLREVRNLPEPSLEKREKSVPIKYRIEPSITKEISKIKKEGQYGVSEIIDIDNDTSYWIKYTNKKDFNNQLDKLKEKYKIKNINIIFHGFRNYTEFIDKEFKELLNEVGIFS